jgi:hypothetical protein
MDISRCPFPAEMIPPGHAEPDPVGLDVIGDP